jgi:hypothetical protein
VRNRWHRLNGVLAGCMDDRHTFLIEEFKALRSEIELYLAEIRRLVGTIWAWLLHERVTDARVWSIPIVLTLHSGAPDHRG